MTIKAGHYGGAIRASLVQTIWCAALAAVLVGCSPITTPESVQTGDSPIPPPIPEAAEGGQDNPPDDEVPEEGPPVELQQGESFNPTETPSPTPTFTPTPSPTPTTTPTPTATLTPTLTPTPTDTEIPEADLPDLPVQNPSLDEGLPESFDQISWTAGGGGGTFGACDASGPSAATLLSLTSVYGSHGKQQVLPGGTFVLDTFYYTFYPARTTILDELPALCATDPAVASGAWALAPDGGRAAVQKQTQGIVVNADGKQWIELGTVYGVTLPLEGLLIPGRWQIIAEDGDETYTLFIDIPPSGPPFVVGDGTRYLGDRFVPNERIMVFPPDKVQGDHTGTFEIQADSSGAFLFSYASFLDPFKTVYIGQSGSVVMPASNVPQEIIDLYYDYAWGRGK